jgi:hypothetical protein
MKKSLIVLILCALNIGFLYAQPLSGPCTIDPSLPASGTNFQSFTAAATRLNSFGVSAAVTFSVKQGQYLENCELADIIGASAVSKITFKPMASNTAPVVLTNPATTLAKGALTLTATKYLVFNGINFETNTGTYTYLVYSSGQIMDISFQNCNFKQLVNGANSVYNTFWYGGSTVFLGNGIEFLNCAGQNAYYLTYHTGSASTLSSTFTMKDCVWDQIKYAGPYMSYVQDVVLHNNRIDFAISTGIQYGVRCYGTASASGRKLDIQGNYIKTRTSSTVYGLYLYYFGANATDRSIVANNFVTNQSFNSTGSRYLFYSYALGNVDIDHNTFYLADGSPSLSRLFYVYNGTPNGYTPGGLNLRNNIFANMRGSNTTAGSLIYVTAAATGYFTAISNNLYWSDNQASVPFYWGSNYNNHSAFAGVSGDVNSLEGDPQFISLGDFHVEGLLANGSGITLTTVNKDIDGDTRPLAPSTSVDIGADEFTPPTCPKPVNFAFVDGTNNTADFTWYSVNASEWELEYGPIGFVRGSGTKVFVNSNPGTISGLLPSRFFHVYLRSVCSPGDTSDFQGPIVFNTYNQEKYLDYESSCGTGFFDVSELALPLNLAYAGEVGFPLAVPMLYQGQLVDRVTVGLNGGILFHTLSGQVSTTIAASSPNAAGWFPFCQALDDVMGGVHHKVLGVSPDRQVYFQWDSVPAFPASATDNPGTFQVMYDEATSEFYFFYPDVEFSQANSNQGGDAEIGVCGINQNINVSMNNTDYLNQHSCIRWYYTDCPKPKNVIMAYLTSEEVAFSWTPGFANETSWLVKFGPAGFNPASVTGQTVNTPQIILPSLQERKKYDIYVYAICSPGLFSEATFTEFTTPPHCANPDNVNSVTKVDSIISTWTWAANNSNTTYSLINFKIYHGELGFTPDASASITIDDANVGDTVLDPTLLSGGVYEYYLQAECGANFKSDKIGPFQIIMPISNELPCSAISLPVDNKSRNFKNGLAGFTAGEQAIAPPVTGLQSTTGWGDNLLEHTTWFKFIAPSTGQIRISGTDQNFDGQFAVYRSTTCNNLSSLVLIGANDNDLLSTKKAPNFTLCGLIPGENYYLLHDSYTAGTSGIYSIRMYEISFEAGQSGPPVNLCTGEIYNLYSSISGQTPGGTWIDLYGSGQLKTDSIFHTKKVGFQEFFFEHRFEDGCAVDSTVIEVEVYPPSYAGKNAEITVCKNEPFNLFHALSGLVNHGGKWYDFKGDLMSEGDVLALTVKLPGTYNYLYVTGNGVCPDDSVEILITVDFRCDYMSLDELSGFNLEIYPNPTNDILNISSLQKFESISILNGIGQTISTIDLKGNNEVKQINVGELSPGVYTLLFLTEGQYFTKRFIKQ